MRVTTPEIAWHDGASPVFSCDLQPLSDENLSSQPLWTRLATCGGGEKEIRMWRILLSIPADIDDMSKSCKENISVRQRYNLAAGTIYHKHILEPLAALTMHKKPVNVVRWSKSGHLLASGSDDCTVCLWKLVDDNDLRNSEAHQISKTLFSPSEDSSSQIESKDKETWTVVKVLKSHLEDVMDICWSPVDDCHLISGAVDNSAIVWRLPLSLSQPPVNNPPPIIKAGLIDDDDGAARMPPTSPAVSTNIKGGAVHCLVLHDHQHYVQGVAWDPRDVFVCSMSSDRSLRVYRVGSRNCLYHVVRARLPHPINPTKTVLAGKLFQDDSWKAFFRRLEFSPDGEFLLCPAGVLSDKQLMDRDTLCSSSGAATGSSSGNLANHQHAAHLFHRSQFGKPLLSYPTQRRAVIAVRFCPQPFTRRPGDSSIFACRMEQSEANDNEENKDSLKSIPLLPYRWVFCLALEDATLLICDTDHLMPIAQLSGLHYDSLNDVSWSTDGRILVTCSRDGYCTIVHFESGELGEPFPRDKITGGVYAAQKQAQKRLVKTSMRKTEKKDAEQKKDNPEKKNPEEKTEVKIIPESQQPSNEDLSIDAAKVSIHPSLARPSPHIAGTKRRVALITLDNYSVPSTVPTPMEIEKPAVASPNTLGSPSIKRRRVSFITLTKEVSKTGNTEHSAMVSEQVSENVPENSEDVESKKRRVSFGESLSQVRYYDPESFE